MKFTLLGATGPTGREVVRQALAQCDQVTAYVRNPHGLTSATGLDVVTGQLADTVALAGAIGDSDAVLICLGTHEKKNVDLMQKSLPLVVEAMKRAGVTRLILLSAYGVGETARTASLIARIAYRFVAAPVFADKAASEATLAMSGIRWTGIYPVILTDGPQTDAVEVRSMESVRKVSGLPKVSRADVARVMLDAAQDDGTVGRKLLVSSPGSVR